MSGPRKNRRIGAINGIAQLLSLCLVLTTIGPVHMKIVARALLISIVCALPAAAAPVRDGQHDFDWELGTWTTQVQRLRHPLSGRSEWTTYSGSSVVRPALDARANLVELNVQGAAGTIAGVSLRLYRPETGEWFLHFANLANGVMSSQVHGSFANGSGAFYGNDTVDGVPVRVRFLIKPLNGRQWRFEQAFSADGCKTWEDNWIAVDTRVSEPVPVSRGDK